MTRGQIQIYTGNGKGKTTAAVGLAVRAAGHNLRTLMVMFMKDYSYGELRGLSHLRDWIRVEQYGDDDFVLRREPPSAVDKATARKALARARDAMSSGEFDIVIVDEICVSEYFKLLTVADGLALLEAKPDSVELILTGRYCPAEWLARADLVTEMHEVKHYYRSGVKARPGFES